MEFSKCPLSFVITFNYIKVFNRKYKWLKICTIYIKSLSSENLERSKLESIDGILFKDVLLDSQPKDFSASIVNSTTPIQTKEYMSTVD
jgi:hypothetical protein